MADKKGSRDSQVREQIAHLKVMEASTYEDVQDAQAQLAAWTKRLLLREAMLASFTFRIAEFERELAPGVNRKRVR